MCAIVFRFAYEEKDVVILRKEFPDTPYHWLEIYVTVNYVDSTSYT